MRWFKEDDFKCKCNCRFDCSDEFKKDVDDARDLAGVPFVLTSAARCLQHNRNIGSKDTSTHVSGLAVDIAYKDELHLTRIVHALSRCGFTRIGVNAKKKFIHADKDPIKPDAVFGY
jgi:zinc D-Ala-D-Ala carboxypeptidase